MKSEFLTELVVVVAERDGYFIVHEKFEYYSERLKRKIEVPKGYETNFASIPQMFQNIIRVNGKHRKAAALHDYLCDHGEELGITQREADFVFNEAMEISDMRDTQRIIMFAFVRAYQAVKTRLERIF